MKARDIVQAKVIEVVNDGSLILSFDGKLLRVVNKSQFDYQEDDMVYLQVTKLAPLEFKLVKAATLST